MTHAADDRSTLALAREVARLRVERRQTGRIVVRAETREEHETVTADLEDVRIEVSRVPVGRDVAALPEVRVEGDVTVFPIVEERLVVTRQLVLTEEIHVRRVVDRRREEVPVTLRREEAVIERNDAPEATTERGGS
jgi:uncharacterized protein (TIGR02271 family)